ncbi:MAG: hypothetical protein OHK93_007837 [Ramalina farinacea]|uniref:Basic proline-rich protein n=1 Tax=Ramalina farinacea TaxID=258253 RepID=A0AA43QLA5_9LECA|nr:hypothetical protein [Ramalina farinacea]
MTPDPSNISILNEKPLPPPPMFSEETAEALKAPHSPPCEPNTPRRATAPETSPSSINPSSFSGSLTSTLPLRPRPKSPFTRGHGRSHSSGSVRRAPQMARAHSSPTIEMARLPLPRPASPLGLGGRHRSPSRRPSEDSFSSFGNDLDIDQTIIENAELEVVPRENMLLYEPMPTSPLLSPHHTFPRTRRRPASPLSQLQPLTPKTPLRSSTSTPSLANGHYNEAYPASYSMSSSSTSTPTSVRSRSPSVSSLETIEDTPEDEAEAESIARLKAAVDREERNEEVNRRRMSFSSDASGRGMRDKRKRWSVCGAERRGDLDLETIWEDGG